MFFSESLPVGRILLAKNGTETVLVDISLLDDYRNLGIGSALLLDLQEKTKSGESLRLSVIKTNPAYKLYERVGFQVCNEDEFYLTMV